jgi:hygromycin-B 4-O-kinase
MAGSTKTFQQNEKITTNQAQAFLTSYLGVESSPVVLLGEGTWSRCFGFCRGDEELVIRFGKYAADFGKDQLAYNYATPDLPIPKLLDIGPAFAGYYAISERVYGVPLESLGAAQWTAVVPALVAALEAMRLTDLSATVGFGGWGEEGKSPHAGWSEHLLTVSDDAPDQRTYGWRDQLAASPQAEALFRRGFDLLQSLAVHSIPRCLVHGDLLNGNALVHEGAISGIFDWGCSLYGDHLYDLAWFEFWAPWHPGLNVAYLRSELERRWCEVGYAPADKEARLMACYLHIGLDHLAYNAYRGDWSALAATAERLQMLVEEVT